MRRGALGLLVLLAVVLGPVDGRGQAGAPLPGMMPAGTLLPAELGRCCDGYRVGHWVDYLVVIRDRREVWNVRLAAVGREGDLWWIEMVVARARGGEAVARMLVDQGEATGPGGRLRRLVVQPEGQLALELPVSEARESLPELDSGDGPGVLVGTGPVRVPAGTFPARHFRRGEGRGARQVWLSDRVPLWGLARYVGPRVEMTLSAMGTGASSRITGEPVPFDPSTLR